MPKTSTQKLKVEWLSVDQLNPYENNPKEHPAEQVSQIADSIRAFGFNDPIAVDENNLIIEGHGRLLAARELGLKKVPVISLAHLSDAEKKAYALAHNKLTLNTGWDLEKLQLELESLKDLGFEELELTGFQSEELETFFVGPDETPAPQGSGAEESKTEISITYQNQYGVIVQCESEEHQQRVYEELIEAGYPCKVVVV